MIQELEDIEKIYEEYSAQGFDEEAEEFQPFDPEKISIDTKPVMMETLLRRLEQGTIILNPDFQRNEVWTPDKKCKLIESLMLKIPLPMFYVSADEKANYYVVDGLQRLSTIRSFVLGDRYLASANEQGIKNEKLKGEGFKLADLEFWGDSYNDLTFNGLPINIRNRILETGFTFTIINPGTPEEVKRNIFKRINTGGEPLTAQEIRHALYSGISTKLLLRLSKTNEFLQATGGSVKPERMLDRELILRTLAFTVRSYTNYPANNNMDTFLSDTMRIINIMPSLNGKEGVKIFKDEVKREHVLINEISVLEERFTKAMTRAPQIFGEHAFRKSYFPKRKTPINKGLFEVWGNLLGQLTDQQFDNLVSNKTSFIEKHSALLDDDNFIYLISRDAQKSPSVKSRYEKLWALLNEFI